MSFSDFFDSAMNVKEQKKMEKAAAAAARKALQKSTQIRNLQSQGHTAEYIATKLGVKLPYVRQIMSGKKYARRKPGERKKRVPITEKEAKSAFKLKFDKGLTMKQIAEKKGWSLYRTRKAITQGLLY